ncbi:MAG: family 78 glycoside hydrolase catalytic domain [Pseudobutyrivibrio sp.]|nr:family 78 glycoside hydrolase catalytic domain [Pseudobutyrivibrio sp.]
MKAIRLKTEYLNNPIGIDITEPRLSWVCEGGVKQSAYQIKAWSADGEQLWDSGKVESSQMHLIPWLGSKLDSRTQVEWQVQLWDENGESGEVSSVATFEIGLLNSTDWKAKWITGNYIPNKKEFYPVDCFRKAITLGNYSKVKSARLYASACGVYEIAINGVKAGNYCLAPGYTDYNKRIQYQTIDVTELVKNAGKSFELTAELASGWYRGSTGAHGLRNQFGTETKLMAQLEIVYANGDVDTVITDETWQWSNDGAIQYADNKDGEFVNANLVPSYSEKVKVTSHHVEPSASNNVALTEHEVFEGKCHRNAKGRVIADIGQNLAGYISMKFNAKEGQILRMRFGELLDENGDLVQKNIQCINRKKISPLQEIVYICKEGLNEYKTKFAIFGFQYVEIETKDFEIDPRDYYGKYIANFERVNGKQPFELDIDNFEIKGIAVYSDIEEIGSFESSNRLLNQFVQATKWSTKSNSADIPTDCPTRERHGWTGDAQIFFKSASYLFDYAAFAEKYLRDVYDWQKKDGNLPMIAPYGGVDSYMNGMNGSVGWSDIGILYPLYFYQMNGDIRILKKYYPQMRKYAKFMQSRCGKWGGPFAKKTGVTKYKKYLVNSGLSYDEWAEPQDVCAFVWTDFAAPHPEVSTAYTAHMMHLMMEIAELTGHPEDVPDYEKYWNGCKAAYQELITKEGFKIDTDRQCRLVRPLAFDLLNEKDTEFAKKRLLRALENYKYRLGTGFLSTPLILDVLTDIDVDAAYKLIENEEIPGWLSMPRLGATTIWESWEGATAVGEVASLNHYSKGALCEWLFRGMCGINMAGENHFVIKPIPGGTFTFTNAEYESVYGKISAGWKVEDGKIVYEVVIPSNTTADIILPDGRRQSVEAGRYEFS